ncbi:MAG: hypothetical protein EBU18_12595 [Rhodobacteraceae bacterium]|nr:hypothetical protein [Paracoccaceae bacterium]
MLCLGPAGWVDLLAKFLAKKCQFEILNSVIFRMFLKFKILNTQMKFKAIYKRLYTTILLVASLPRKTGQKTQSLLGASILPIAKGPKQARHSRGVFL